MKEKPLDFKSDSYVEYNFNINKKDPEFKVEDHVRITRMQEYKDISVFGYQQN